MYTPMAEMKRIEYTIAAMLWLNFNGNNLGEKIETKWENPNEMVTK